MPFRKRAFNYVVPHLAVGLVFTLALFVLHDAALFVEFLLRDGAQHVSHAVGFHPERHVERGLRNILEIVGAIEVCRTVHVRGANAFEGLEVLVVVVLGAVEHQVFKQVREAGFAGLLVLGADVVPDVDGDDRRLVVLVDNQPETVVERVFGVGNFNVGGRRDGSDGHKSKRRDGRCQGRMFMHDQLSLVVVAQRQFIRQLAAGYRDEIWGFSWRRESIPAAVCCV